jgi:hypothetical protein
MGGRIEPPGGAAAPSSREVAAYICKAAMDLARFAALHELRDLAIFLEMAAIEAQDRASDCPGAG